MLILLMSFSVMSYAEQGDIVVRGKTIKLEKEGAVKPLKSVKNIVVKGKVIRVGDTFDSVLSVIKQSDVFHQSVKNDNQGNMHVFKYIETDGKKFCLTIARIEYPGPYRIILIDLL